MSRRVIRALLLLTAGAGLGCLPGPSISGPAGSSAGGRLAARPHDPAETITPGLWPLGNGGADGILLVPDNYVAATAVPLVVALHGAGITAQGPLGFLGQHAQESGFLLYVPESRAATWDAIVGSYGPDVAAIDRGLAYVFDHCMVDRSRITLEGFSDGASYALGLGILNSQVFTRIVAFSPGFITATTIGDRKPDVFLSHGLSDPVLPVEGSRRIVNTLRAAGFTVDYREYDGVHSVTPDIARSAVQFIMKP